MSINSGLIAHYFCSCIIVRKYDLLFVRSKIYILNHKRHQTFKIQSTTTTIARSDNIVYKASKIIQKTINIGAGNISYFKFKILIN